MLWLCVFGGGKSSGGEALRLSLNPRLPAFPELNGKSRKIFAFFTICLKGRRGGHALAGVGLWNLLSKWRRDDYFLLLGQVGVGAVG